MQTARITTKGQVTIPVSIRQRFNLKPGGRVMFSVEDQIIILRPVPINIEESFGLVDSDHSVSLENMDRIIREQAGK